MGWTPVIGVPQGMKPFRVDFSHAFEGAIEHKGYRLAWSRAARCPCSSPADTDQADPLCTLCKGRAWLYFGPPGYQIDEAVVGTLDPVQRAYLERTGACVIHGIMSSLGLRTDDTTELGPWMRDDSRAMVTVRAENKLGYYDRLMNLDAEIGFTQVVEVPESGLETETRYPVRQVLLARTLDKQMFEGEHFTLVAGKIVWIASQKPAAKARVALYYLTHPTWLVVDYPNAFRATLQNKKLGKKASTPDGEPIPLPVRAHVQYEFVPRTTT